MINMEEEVFIQTINEVNNIDYAKEANELFNSQQEEIQNNMDIISEQLNDIQSTITTVNNDIGVDAISEVASLVENIDTTIVESQNQDILSILDNQQKQINTIEEKIDMIISKLEM